MAAFNAIRPGWDYTALRLYAKPIDTWTIDDWIDNELLGPGKPSGDNPDRRVVPLKTKIFGKGKGAPIAAYCPTQGGPGSKELLVSEARAKIMALVEREYGAVELVPGTLIFHSNEYFGADVVMAEPFGGPMTMPFLKHYGDSQATVSRRIFCNLAMTPTLLVKGNFAASVSIYVVTKTIRLFKLPRVANYRFQQPIFLKDMLGFSEASTFKDYTAARNFDGMYMLTAVDETTLMNTEIGLRIEKGGLACFPEVALFHGHTKLVKIGQVDLLQNLPGGVTLGAYRNEIMRIGKERFIARTAEIAVPGTPKEPTAKQSAVGAMNRKLWADLLVPNGGLTRDMVLSVLVNNTLRSVQDPGLWGSEVIRNDVFGISPGTQQGYWKVRDYEDILRNKKYVAAYPRDRTSYTLPMAIPENPPLTEDQEQQLLEVEELKAANAAALLYAEENDSFQLIGPDLGAVVAAPAEVVPADNDDMGVAPAQPVAHGMAPQMAAQFPGLGQGVMAPVGQVPAPVAPGGWLVNIPPMHPLPTQPEAEQVRAQMLALEQALAGGNVQVMPQIAQLRAQITAVKAHAAQNAAALQGVMDQLAQIVQQSPGNAQVLAQANAEAALIVPNLTFATQLNQFLPAYGGRRRHTTPRVQSRRRTPRHSR